MQNIDIKKITESVVVDSKEAMILLCTMEILATNPHTKITNLEDKLSKKDYLIDKNITVIGRSYAGLEHYYSCAKMYIRLINALKNRTPGHEYWDDKCLNKMLSSGILLCDQVYTLLRIRDDHTFLMIMKRTLDSLSPVPSHNEKARVNAFLINEFEKRDISEFNPPKNVKHDGIRDRIGMNYLHELGCEFVTKEAILEKQDRVMGRPGLRLDIYGWRKDATIVGMEVKTKLKDFDGTLMDERFGRYAEYCNEFYILTTKKSVYKAAQRWCKRHSGTAALYYDGNENGDLEKTMMQPSGRRTTEKMIRKAQEVLIAKIRKRVMETYMDTTICTPAKAFQEVIRNLSKEINF